MEKEVKMLIKKYAKWAKGKNLTASHHFINGLKTGLKMNIKLTEKCQEILRRREYNALIRYVWT